MSVFAVVMAGGSGTRFWPLSRRALPKQLLALGGDTHESLIRATVRRIAPIVPPERVLVVTAASLAARVRQELPEVPAQNVLAEPAARNTAPCVGWAAQVAKARDPEAVLAVLAADHYVKDEDAYRTAVRRALAVAEDGTLVTIGITPTRAETGYGYLELGEELSPGVRRVARFVEKPDVARASAMVADGKHLWNSGTFFFRADAVLAEIAAHLPALADGLAAIALEPARLGEIFGALPRVSLDVGVMEKAARIAVLPGDFGWSDVGSFATAWELSAKDTTQNAVPPDAVIVDSKRCLVRTTPGKIVALIGVEDLVVIDTDDALLVVPRDRAQDVRAVVDALTARGSEEKL
jgi:mannose-1-phosphate guanylyltransferase